MQDDIGLLLKQLCEDDEEEGEEHEKTQLLSKSLKWVKRRNKTNTYSSAGAVGVDVGESATVKSLLHISLSSLRLVPSDLQQLVLRKAGERSAFWRILEGSSKWRRQAGSAAHLD